MSDDLNRKIQQIAELLGQDSMPDNVKGLLSALSGSLSEKEAPEEEPADLPAKRNDQPDKPADNDDFADMLVRAKKVMDRLNTGTDPRINLLHAIRPFMNNKRQQKIGNCIKILQVISLTRLMDFNEKQPGRD